MRDIAGDGRVRVSLERGAVAAAPAGAIADPTGLRGLRWLDCALPNTAAGALRAAHEASMPAAADWWWRVQLADARSGDWLDFAGIAGTWDAWLDGAWVAAGRSMYEPRTIELEAPARELVIRSAGTPSGAAVGPWRPIVLERGGARIGAIGVDARVEAGLGFVTVGAQLDPHTDRAVLVIRRGHDRRDQPLALQQNAWTGCAIVDEPARWWPHGHGEPVRYELSIEAAIAGRRVGIDLGTSGFRTVALEGGGSTLHVNGVPLSGHDATWTPVDPVTLRATPQQYAAAITAARARGIELVRIGSTIRYEDEALYDALDAHGVLLGLDLMFDARDDPTSAVAELDRELARLQGRPCVAFVCGSGHDALRARLAERVRAALPAVPYLASRQ